MPQRNGFQGDGEAGLQLAAVWQDVGEQVGFSAVGCREAFWAAENAEFEPLGAFAG